MARVQSHVWSLRNMTAPSVSLYQTVNRVFPIIVFRPLRECSASKGGPDERAGLGTRPSLRVTVVSPRSFLPGWGQSRE